MKFRLFEFVRNEAGTISEPNFQCRILLQKYCSAHGEECARFMSASVHRP